MVERGTWSSLVVGANGLLGRAVARELEGRGDDVVRARVRWADHDAARADLAAAVDDALAVADGRPLGIWWCAGAGVTATPEHVLEAERRLIEEFCDDLREVVRGRGSDPCAVFFASSAGGVYAGSDDPPFTERTAPVPLAAYGRYKLREEEAFASLSADGVAVALGRIANIYGPGQDLAKPQGLISQLCVSHQRLRPLNIYVSLDTLRDYIYVEDAAAMVADLGRASLAVAQDRPVVKIIASGRSTSIGTILGEMRRLFKRRVPVVLGASPYARQQARDLRLQSVILPELDARPLVGLMTGIDRTNRDIGDRVRSALGH